MLILAHNSPSTNYCMLLLADSVQKSNWVQCPSMDTEWRHRLQRIFNN